MNLYPQIPNLMSFYPFLSNFKALHGFKNIKILLSFSGGQDSTILIFWNNTIFKIHSSFFNHLLQKDNFFFMDHFYKLQFFLNQTSYCSIPLYCLSNEKQASIWRYQLLFRIAHVYNYLYIFIGSSATDLVEKTVLLLTRGSGKFYSRFLIKDKSLYQTKYFLFFI